jgi:hypothetical protein
MKSLLILPVSPTAASGVLKGFAKVTNGPTNEGWQFYSDFVIQFAMYFKPPLLRLLAAFEKLEHL